MIKRFRNIRKKLTEQGKTSNYLKYAIGEIMNSPVRDNIRVALFMKHNPRAFRYEILDAVPNGTLNLRNKYLLPR